MYSQVTNTLSDSVKSFDIFGKRIEMSFNNKGKQHTTILGGICTLMVYTFFIYYITLMLTRINKL